MQIKPELISHLEHLTRLELSTEERASLLTDLNNILNMVQKLQELDLEDVAPKVYMHDASNPLRPDTVQGQCSREEAFRNAPEHDGAHFLTPKVIDLKA